MKLIFYADLHLYGPHAMSMALLFTKDTYYIGDIVDKSNVLKKDIDRAESYRKLLLHNADGNYINGNHELAADSPVDIIREGICITHGDIFDYNKKTWYHWHYQKEPGRKSWKRSLIGIKHWGSKFLRRGVGKKNLKAAAEYAKKHDCHTIVYGHKHPYKVVDKMIDNIRVICLPRGKTEIEFK